MDKTELLIQEQIKGLDGKSARQKIKDYLKDSLLADAPEQDDKSSDRIGAQIEFENCIVAATGTNLNALKDTAIKAYVLTSANGAILDSALKEDSKCKLPHYSAMIV